MIYTAYLDGTPLLDIAHDITLASAKLDLADNKAGSFKFDLNPDNPCYRKISGRLLTGIVTVKWADEILFKGRILTVEKDFYGTLSVTAEGELAYLADSIQRPAEYHQLTVRQFLSKIVESHNQQVGKEKQFEVGSVTVTDSNDSLYRYTNWEDSLKTIQDDLIGSLGGHLRVRYEGTHRYLDYLAEYPRLSDQRIEFGENLLDYSETASAADLATVCIPLGARLEESPIEALEARLTIADVNSGSDAVEISSAVQRYGRIAKVVKFDDVHTASILKTRGQSWLTDNQYESLELSLTALDLQDFGLETDHFRILDLVHCTSKPHGMDRQFPITSVSLNLLAPDKNKYVLGSAAKTFTSSTASNQAVTAKRLDEVPNSDRILKSAQENATALINMAGKDGHVVFSPDIRSPNEILIMDEDRKEDAKRVWRWNVNGLGYSSSGYLGPFETAITMDGTIAGKFLAAGTVAADKINIGYTSTQEKKWKDELGKNYWTASQVKTQITNTADSITLSVNQKVNKNDVINQINISTEGTKIKASKFDIDADSIRMQASKLAWKSTNSSMTSSGTLTCHNANISGSFSAGFADDYSPGIVIEDGMIKFKPMEITPANGFISYSGPYWEQSYNSSGGDSGDMITNDVPPHSAPMIKTSNSFLLDLGDLYIKEGAAESYPKARKGWTGNVTVDGHTFRFVKGICVYAR